MMPSVREAFASPDPSATIQPLAEAVRQATGLGFVVVSNRAMIRYSHPNPALIGQPLQEGDEPALAGQAYVVQEDGSLGSSIRAKEPIYGADGVTIIGVVPAGILAERLQPDLVILDVYLPDLSGLAVLHELRRLSPGTDVIMVTAARDVASVQQAMQGGAVQYIVKPFSFARYQQALDTYLQLWQRRATVGAVEQADVDRLYAVIGAGSGEELPKGLDRPTLELVVKQLQEQARPLSAQETARGTGVSRATARRYLEYLATSGRATRQLLYGSAGRPEHLYQLL